jgi:hypothetical protein
MAPCMAARHLHLPVGQLGIFDGFLDMLIGMPGAAHTSYLSILLTLVNGPIGPEQCRLSRLDTVCKSLEAAQRF